jgi:hypothetical protein
MSTKTTFKRIALVAVAALTLGSFSAVSATAAPSVAYTTMYDTTNGYQVVGGQATVTISVDTSTVTSVVLSGVGSVLSASVGTNTPTITGTPTTGTFYITGGSGGVSTSAVVLTSAVAGTSTLTVTPLGSNGAPGTAVTKTITWAASFTTKSVSATTSTSLLIAGSSTTAGTSDAVVVADKAAGRAATIKVTLLDANSAAVNDLSLSATISGSGLVKASTDGTAGGDARATSVTLTGANVGYIAVNSDGTAGVATVTISAGSTVIATETVTFSGSATLYTVKQNSSVYAATTAPSTPGTQTISVTVTDAAGNKVVDGTTVYATSATTTVAAVTASATTTAGVATFTITGAATGTSVITFGNAASSATVSTTTTVTVGSATIASVKMTTDKASYLPGEKITLTVSAMSSAATPVADGTYTVFSTAPTSSMALSAGTLPVASIALVGGVKTYTLNAPLAEGEFTIAGADNLTALNAVSVSAVVENAAATAAATAAADAAAEATDAANAATDAANAAAEAADAATAAAQDSADAVAALSVQVATYISNLRKQITALTNLVIKIQKKVKA